MLLILKRKSQKYQPDRKTVVKYEIEDGGYDNKAKKRTRRRGINTQKKKGIWQTSKKDKGEKEKRERGK